MHDIRYLAKNFSEASERLARRGFELPPDVQILDHQRRTLAQHISQQRAAAKQEAALIGRLRSAGELGGIALQERTDTARAQREAIQIAECQQREVSATLQQLLLSIPNFPADRVPAGLSDHDNVELRSWRPRKSHGAGTKDHLELGKALGIIDIETAAKIAGSRFSILRGKGAVLQRALGTFMLDRHTSAGYEEVIVPLMTNADSMTGTGQLPKFEEDMFKTSVGNKTFYLSPTSEVQMTNMHADTIVPESSLTAKYTTLTDNFRSEAGSAGRDVRGIFRQHQFPKVELVKIAKPSESDAEWSSLVGDAEGVLQDLGLQYRAMDICTGDLSFGASYSNDLEVWLPGQNQYREISSCSNFTDFQARRMNARYRTETGDIDYVHTMNGSGLAVGRTIIAVMEQYQQADGSVRIPEILHPYTGFTEIKPQ